VTYVNILFTKQYEFKMDIISDSEFEEITGVKVKNAIKHMELLPVVEMDTVTYPPEEHIRKIQEKLSNIQKVEEVDEEPTLEESSQNKDESEEEITPLPLQIVLSRQQTRKQVEDALMKGTETMEQRRKYVNGIRVPIEGWNHLKIHPSMNKDAKKKYAEAIEWGLIGFMMFHGFESSAKEVYCMAYAQAQMKNNGKLRFKKINPKHMVETTNRSMQVYMDLLWRNNYKPQK
jgi:hypothetical protein